MTRTIHLLASLLLLSTALTAQSTATFKKHRTDTQDGGFFCLDQAPNGVFWVGGYAGFGDLFRFQEDGNLLQSIRFKEVDNYRPFWTWDIEAAADNGAWALFYLDDKGGQARQALQLVRLDGAGNLRWHRTLVRDKQFASLQSYLSTDLNENAYTLSNLNYLVDSNSLQVQKTSPTGDLIWSKAYRMPNGYPYVRHIVCLADGSLLVGGLSGPYTNDRTGFLLNIGPDGQVLWGKTYPDFYLVNFVQLPGGDLLLTGDNWSENQYKVMRTNSNGQVKWSKSWQPDGRGGFLYNLAQNTAGNLLIMDGCGADVVCVSPEGDFLWAKNYDPCRIAYIPDGIVTRDGGIAFLDIARRFIKTDATGNIAGCATFDVKLEISPQNVTYSTFSVTPFNLPLPQQLLLEPEAYTITISDFATTHCPFSASPNLQIPCVRASNSVCQQRAAALPMPTSGRFQAASLPAACHARTAPFFPNKARNSSRSKSPTAGAATRSNLP